MKQVTFKIVRILLMLAVSIMGLNAQMLILSPEENSVTNLHHIAVTVMGKPSAETKLYLNNEFIAQGEIRADGQYDFLNISAPDGPVLLRVESIGAAERLYVAERTIHVLGQPDDILPYDNNIKLAADGKSTKLLKFEIKDEWGYSLSYVKLATIDITDGSILNEDLDKRTPGIQVPVKDGILEITIKSPSEATRAVLEFELMGHPFQIPIRFTTPQEPFILLGSTSAGLSNYQAFPEDENQPDVEEWRQDSGSILGQEMMYGGRVAFYAKGSIFNKFRLTASYDSKRNYKDQFYQDIDPSEQYAVYGDASTLEYDAQTQSELFVKLEHNESSIMFGDYDTDLGKSEFTAYNRTFNGFTGKLQGSSQSLTGFITLTDQNMQLDEIRGEGISGYYYLSKTNVTELSDKIMIQTRDRYHSEVILKSQDLTRYQDYTINYEDGSIMFKQPVASIDADGNPITIVISYEYKSGKREALIAGASYNATLFKKLKLDAIAITEERESSNYWLYGANATLPLFKWLSIKGEYAGSITPELNDTNSTGKAYKAELQFKPAKEFVVNAYYRTVDSSFVNQSQTGRSSETGSRKYGFKALLGNDKTGVLSSEYYQQLNKQGTVNENSAEVFNVSYQRAFGSKVNTKIAYEDAGRHQQTVQDSTTERHSQLIKANFTYKLSDKLSGVIEREQNLMNMDQSKPTHSSIGLNYSITKKLGIFVKYKRIEGENAGNQWVFGVDSKVGENTELEGKYEIGGATGESRNRATIGFKNKWSVTKDLTLNFAYENVSTSDHFEIPTVEHQSLSASFEYLPEIPFKLTGKWEFRIKSDSRKYNYMVNTDFKIAHGLAVIGKSIYSKTNYLIADDNMVIKSDNQFGLAYRPERSDHYNCLIKVGYLVDRNTHIQSPMNSERFILSSHHYWQPFTKLEIGVRLARRTIADEEIGLFKDKVTTDFIAVRLEYDLSLKWYTALDLRYIHLQPLDETKLGSSVEIGYLLAKNLQVGLGYSIQNFDDPDFAMENQSFKNFFMTLHMKFSQDLFNWH